MKSLCAFILGAILTLTAVGCAALTPVAPQLVSGGISLVQAAIQLKGIAQSLSGQPDTSAETLAGYAKWAETIAGAIQELQPGK